MSLTSPALVLPRILEALKVGDNDAKDDALAELAQIMDSSYGEDAEALCEYLRVAGGVGLICKQLQNDEPAIHQTALLLIGNLASEAVDPQASATKAVLKRNRAFEYMLLRLFSSDWMTLVYALGAVQNTCTEIEYVELMQETGAVQRLQELVHAGDPQLEQYAKGCLANMRQTILVAATKRQMETQIKNTAAAHVQAAARRLAARHRVNVLRAEQQKTISSAQKNLLGTFGLAPEEEPPAAEEAAAPKAVLALLGLGAAGPSDAPSAEELAAAAARDETAAKRADAAAAADDGAGALGSSLPERLELSRALTPAAMPESISGLLEDGGDAFGKGQAGKPGSPGSPTGGGGGLGDDPDEDPDLADDGLDALALSAVTAAQNSRVREKQRKETVVRVANAEQQALQAMEAAAAAAEQAMEAARRAEEAANEATKRAELAEARAREEKEQRLREEAEARAAMERQLEEQRASQAVIDQAEAKAKAEAAEQKRLADEAMERQRCEAEELLARKMAEAEDERRIQEHLAEQAAERAAIDAKEEAEREAKKAAEIEAARVAQEKAELRVEMEKQAAVAAAAAAELARKEAEEAAAASALTPEEKEAMRLAEEEKARAAAEEAAAIAAAEEAQRQLMLSYTPVGMAASSRQLVGRSRTDDENSLAAIAEYEQKQAEASGGAGSSQNRLEMLGDLFRCFDKDEDGVISYDEFMRQFDPRELDTWPESVLEQMRIEFRKVDTDADGSISKVEFIAWKLDDTAQDDDAAFAKMYGKILKRDAVQAKLVAERDEKRRLDAIDKATKEANRTAEERRMIEDARDEDIEQVRPVEQQRRTRAHAPPPPPPPPPPCPLAPSPVSSSPLPVARRLPT